MIDITSAGPQGLSLFNTQVTKATNVLSTQIGALEYLPPTFGIDLEYFLSEEFRFQNDSFKAYLVQQLAQNSINVASVVEVVENLFETLQFNLKAPENNPGLVAG